MKVCLNQVLKMTYLQILSMCSLSSSCEDDEAFLTENCRNCFNLGNRVVTLYKERGDREGERGSYIEVDMQR